MAKNIKAIKCPHCGSVQKTVVSEHVYRCNSCHTEYFLDDDDINININHSHHNPVGNAAPNPFGNDPAKAKKVLIGVALVIGFMFLMGMFTLFSGSDSSPSTNYVKEKAEYRYNENYVYANTANGQPVLLRFAQEQLVGEDRNYDFVNIYALFINPVTKDEIKRQILFKRARRLGDHSARFEELSNGDIYINYSDQTYYKINRENNTLVDITTTLFQNHPQASSGIAKLSMYGDSWDLLTNDGKKFSYIPISDKLFNDGDYHAIQAEEKAVMQPTFYKFSYDDDRRLLKVTRTGDEPAQTDVDPSRKYFAGKIMVQGPGYLLIQCNTSASPQAPIHLQRIDVNTGKVLWTTKASSFEYRNATKVRDGFAAFYFSGEDMDYQSGVHVFSNDGRLLHDYKIARGGEPM